VSKTIKQLADELGVSKTAIRKYMTAEFRENYVETTANGVLVINEEGENQLQSLRKQPQKPQTEFAETTENSGLQYVIDTQKGTIELLKEQLAVKDEQIRTQQEQLTLKEEQIGQLTAALDNTTAALTAAQALHAADKKQLLIEDKQQMSWWERRKARKAEKKAEKERNNAENKEF
jgi:predicted ArsR family transcriptional regulator